MRESYETLPAQFVVTNSTCMLAGCERRLAEDLRRRQPPVSPIQPHWGGRGWFCDFAMACAVVHKFLACSFRVQVQFELAKMLWCITMFNVVTQTCANSLSLTLVHGCTMAAGRYQRMVGWVAIGLWLTLIVTSAMNNTGVRFNEVIFCSDQVKTHLKPSPQINPKHHICHGIRRHHVPYPGPSNPHPHPRCCVTSFGD